MCREEQVEDSALRELVFVQRNVAAIVELTGDIAEGAQQVSDSPITASVASGAIAATW